MDINIFPNHDDQVQNLVHKIEQLVRIVLKKKDTVVIAVSGGKSPVKLFDCLSQLSLPWKQIIVTLVDERMTPETSEDSNSHLVQQHLIQNKAAGANFMGLFHENISTGTLITQLNATIPSIDIAILGMGEDGHTASLFPDCVELNSALDMNNSSNYIITNPISAKYSRVSLTMAALVAIPHIVVSINGAIKFKVYEEARLEATLNYPISYLLKQRQDIDAYWFK